MQADWNSVLEVFFGLALVSLIVEQMFTPIFNYRHIAPYIKDKGIKTPAILVVSWLLALILKLNIIDGMLVAFKKPPLDKNQIFLWFVGTVMTALIISGGSAGIFNILKKIGGRDMDALIAKVETETKKKEDEAKKRAAGGG